MTAADEAAWEAIVDRLFHAACTEIDILPSRPGDATPFQGVVNVDTVNYADSDIVSDLTPAGLDRIIAHRILPHLNIDLPPGEELPPISAGTFTYSEEFPEGLETVRARVQIITRPASQGASCVIFCKLPQSRLDLPDLVANGTLPEDAAMFLSAAITARCSIAFSGAPGAGKTSLLNACTFEIGESEKVAVLQDVDELPLEHIAIQQKLFTHKAVARSKAAIHDGSMSSLIEVVKLSRPDRIIVGECRDGAMLDYLEAANIFRGALVTLHADSTKQALRNIFIFANKHPHSPGPIGIWELVAGGVDLIVHLAVVDGQRRVTEIAEVGVHTSGGDDQTPTLTSLWQLNEAHELDMVNRPSDALLARLRQA